MRHSKNRCVRYCNKLIETYGAKDIRFEVKPFKGTLIQLRDAAQENEKQFLSAVKNAQEALTDNDWFKVNHWTSLANKLKPRNSKVKSILKQSKQKRAKLKRKTTFKIAMQIAAVMIIMTMGYFVYHYTQLWRHFSASRIAENIHEATKAAEQIEWFYAPAEQFLSACNKQNSFSVAQKQAQDVIGYINNNYWSMSQKASSSANTAFENNKYIAAGEMWSKASHYCKQLVASVSSFTVEVSPSLENASIRISSSENKELHKKQGAELYLKVPEGIYHIDVTHPDYESYHCDLTISDNSLSKESITVDLKPLPATLIIRSKPQGKITEDGHVIGYTAEELILTPGGHELIIEAEHYKRFSSSIHLYPNDKVDLDITLIPLDRKLKITCDPVATVIIDGFGVGNTDDDIYVPVGKHKMTLQAKGYKKRDFEITVMIGRDAVFKTKLELLPQLSKLLILCDPKAVVYADRMRVGHTGEAISLSEGEHTIVLVAKGFKEKKLKVTIGYAKKPVMWNGTLDIIPALTVF